MNGADEPPIATNLAHDLALLSSKSVSSMGPQPSEVVRPFDALPSLLPSAAAPAFAPPPAGAGLLAAGTTVAAAGGATILAAPLAGFAAAASCFGAATITVRCHSTPRQVNAWQQQQQQTPTGGEVNLNNNKFHVKRTK